MSAVLGLIAKKRDGQAHSRGELDAIATGAANGTIPDYQLAAWLMAVYLNGMTAEETRDLTIAMSESGERLDLTGLPKPWVDKHSTGGVGDKTTLVVLPMMAAAGITMVKMSGRGLGITGGTVDKLESIPGMRLDLSPEEMKAQAARIGIALTGQTPRLAPADGVLYALRDVTATVPCQPLIVSSILSKKLAGGAEWVSFDVKCGSGSFMPRLDQAAGLAKALKSVGEAAGLKVLTHVTDMDQPLGKSAGNALEVKEAVSVLKGESHGRFRDLCVALVDDTLAAIGNQRAGADLLDSGLAWAKFGEWVTAQGGDVAAVCDPNWAVAPTRTEVRSAQSGFVAKVDALAVGQAVVDLGGGRKQKSDTIDPRVGVETMVEVGDRVTAGQVLFVVHSAGTSVDLSGAIEIVDHEVASRPVMLG